MLATLRFLIVIIAVLWLGGCHTIREYNYLAKETLDYRDKKITSIVTNKGDVIYYDVAGARYIVDVKDTIVSRKVIGFNLENRPISTPAEDILEISCESRELDAPGTGLSILGAAAVILLAVLAAAFSNFR